MDTDVPHWLLVQKYGGTSVGDADRIRRVADRIKSYHDRGHSLVVVVSAMGKTTDRLETLAAEISGQPPKREMDMLLATGEQVSIALLAMALHEIDVPAVSFTGAQVGILTDDKYSKARIESIRTDRLRESLAKGLVCIVAGFQGVDSEDNITTLGRGGSDTTAVALAAALEANECEIFTDVDGVYTADPNIVQGARLLKRVSYEEMLELASLGAGVLHGRAVEFAKKYGVILHVRSSFNYTDGTLIVPEEKIMEKLLVTGVTTKKDEVRFTFSGIPDQPGKAAEIFQTLASESVNVDMIVQTTGEDQKNTISFTVPERDLATAKEALEALIEKWGTGSIETDDEIAVISVVGLGMKSYSGVAALMFSALANKEINIDMISTSEIKISAVIRKNRTDEAVGLIHDAFHLNG